MIPDYLEEFKVWELWNLSEDENKYELHEVEESILNVWKLWKSSKDQNKNEFRSEAFEMFKNCMDNLTLRYMCLSIVPNVFPYGLKELDLSANKLTQIPVNLPETLKILNMDNNLVCIIPEKLPSNLQELLMGNNKIVNVPETLPDSIVRLNFCHNMITSLPNKLPKNLIKLELYCNYLSHLPENLPKSLEKLDVGTNRLTELPKNLPNSLCKLYASSNELTYLPDTLPEMLKEINIRGNYILSLPEQFPKSLKKLNASDNIILNLNIFAESLIELNIDDNRIEEISDENFNLPNLEKLYISENKLISLPENLPETLCGLYAFSNYLSTIPNNLPKSLIELYLDGNHITTLPKNLPLQLIQLSLNYNQLTEIPTGLPQTLVSLGLASNDITEVSSNIENIPDTKIYLEGNLLNEFSLEYLRRILRTTNRPEVWFNGSHEYYENFIEARPLIEEITKWLNNDLLNPYWNIISAEMISRPFSRFLYRIRHTQYFEVEQFKKDVSKWLYSLGEENDSKKKLREKIFLVAEEASETCDHRLGWCLNQMKILSIAHDVESGKYDNKIEDLIKLAHEMYRLHVLERISRRTVQNIQDDCDEIEVYLEYQVRLQDIFDLPISTPKMVENYTFVLSDDDIKHAIKEIIDEEKIEFTNYLLINWQPWKEVLKRWNYDKYIKSKNDVKNEKLFKEMLDKRKKEYLLETNMSNISLDVEIQLGSQVQLKIEKNIWLKLTNEFLESMHLETI